MKMISCIAIDDEPLALTILSEYIAKVPFLKLLGTFSNANDAAYFIQDEKPEIMFLDIQMPEIKGTDFIKTLVYKPITILTTAYSEYALESYNLDAVDYLLKPIPFERFLQAMNKATRLIGSESTNGRPDEKAFIFVKSGYKSIKVDIEEIQYIEGSREYVTLHTRNHKYMQLDTLKNLEQILSGNLFLRVHKSFIVNIKHIHAQYGNTLEINEKEIPIGRAYKDVINRLLT